MGLDTIIDVHPKRLRTVAEADDAISKIKRYQQRTGCKVAGVIVMQNDQLGAGCEVRSEEEWLEGKENPGAAERYGPFYPLSYYEGEREKLLEKQKRDYS